MRYGSVCSGIEAASQAWHPLGWSPVFFSEVDKFPSAVLAHHYGSNMPDEAISGNGVPNYGDMTKFEGWPDHAIDVLVGGTPCQDYSVAGLRAGMAGDRGSLTLTFIQIAARYRPKWFVWENVPGVLSSNNGRDFAKFLGDFTGTKIPVPVDGWKNSGFVAGIQDAYGVAYVVRDAQYVRVDGFGRAVPQRRRRVFVVGCLGNWRRAAAVLLEPESLQRNSAPCRSAGKIFAGTIDAGFGRRRGSGMNPNQLASIIPAVANPLTARMHKGINTTCDEGQTPLPIAFNSREDAEVTLDRSGSLGAGSPQAKAVAFDLRGREGGAQLEGPHDTANIRAADGGSSRSYVAQVQAVAFKPSHYTRGKDGSPSDVFPPLSADADKGDQDPVILRDWAVRRLTPRECERLQGFPDDHTRIPWRNKAELDCPDGPRYKALGNSMAVNAMRWIGRRINMIEELL